MLGFNILVADWYNLRLVQARIQLPRKTKARFVVIFILLGTFLALCSSVLSPDDNIIKQQPQKYPRIVDNQLIDLKNFEIASNNTLCQKKDKGKKLLQIGIHSSRKNYNRRAAIRSTWGSMKAHNGWEISIAFLLGSHPVPPKAQDEAVSAIVNNETKMYGDIVTGAFTDSYRNLTYKHMMGYKWILDACPEVDAYVKTDDDVFVNVFKLVDWLNSNEIRDNLYCYVLRGYSPWRSKRYKFYISKDEYRPDRFPDYCSGIGYITRPTMMRKLFEVSKRMKYLWVEDLFSTGLLTKHYNEELARKLDFEADLLDDTGNSSQTQAKILQVDISTLYLNEQYAAYKRWINDSSENTDKWLFILLENTNEQLLSLEQTALWQKTATKYRTRATNI